MQVVWRTAMAMLVVALGAGWTAAAEAVPTDLTPSVPRHIVLGTHGVTWGDVLDTDNPAHALRQFAANATIAQAISTNGTEQRCAMDGWLSLNTSSRVTDRVAGVCRERSSWVIVSNNQITDWQSISDQAAGQPYRPELGLLARQLAESNTSATALGVGAAVALADANGMVAGTTVLPQDMDELRSAVTVALDSSQLIVVDADSVHSAASSTAVAVAAGGGAGGGGADSSSTAGVPDVERMDALERLEEVFGIVVAGLNDSRIPSDQVAITVVSLSDDGLVQAPGSMQFFAMSAPAGSGDGNTTADPDARATGPAGPAGPTGPTGPTGPAGGESDISAATVGTSPGGLATSGSTRQDGLVLTTDVSATVLTQLGVAGNEAIGIGSPISQAADSPDTAEARFEILRDMALRADAGMRSQLPMLILLGSFSSIVALIATWPHLLRRLRLKRVRTTRVTRLLGLVLASTPASVLIASGTGWWRAPYPAAALIGMGALVTAIVVTIVYTATRIPRWGISPAAAAVTLISAITWLVITVDVARGAIWSSASPLGTQPLQAGRFHGMNNTAFAFFAVTSLVLIGMVGTRLVARSKGFGLVAMIVFAALCVGVDLAPNLGADFGGALALAPGLVLAILAVTGVRLTWQRIVLGLVGTSALVLGIGAIDALRPVGDRTHLGSFVSTLWSDQTVVTVQRKLHGAFGFLFDQPILAVVAVALIVGAGLVASQWRDAARLPSWTWAIVLTCVIGSLLNDSGPAIAAWMGMLSVGLFVARRGARLMQSSVDRGLLNAGESAQVGSARP